jgi:hypothetical protein
MKTKISENEIKYILELHSKEKNYKNVISEQSQDLESRLQAFIDNKCVDGGEVVSTTESNLIGFDATNPNYKKAIEKQSVKNPENTVYYFIDYTLGVKDKSGSFKIIEGKWGCPKINADAKGPNVRKLEGFTPKQKELILKYQNYRLKSEIGFDEIGSWEQFTLNFPDGSGSVILYKDPTSQSDVKFKSSTDEKTKTLIPSKNRAEVCRKKIQDFADSANKKLKLPMSQINTDKSFVMACRDQFGMKYNDLGVTKKNLEYLTGQRDGLDGYKLKVGSPYRV